MSTATPRSYDQPIGDHYERFSPVIFDGPMNHRSQAGKGAFYTFRRMPLAWTREKRTNSWRIYYG